MSFPEYKSKSLGRVLRLFSETKEQLETLNVKALLNRFSDYTHCKMIQKVDETKIKKCVCFKRKQFKSPHRISEDIERRAKYLANKNNGDFDEIKSDLIERSKSYDDKSTLPFINLISLSSKPDALLPEKDRFLLFIEMQSMGTEIKGDFTCYGLSRRDKDKQATIPWF